jgi:hypothetical protein
VLGASAVQRVLVGAIGGVAIGAFFAAGGHLIIRAFELGRREEPAVRPPTSRSAGA